ncbi:Uncharacterized protein BM_BM7610 [Brugia malayi]|uniref:Bm7610, isoform b; Bm7610, isoform e n=1 Tax=Brugia malayi TaxID=6279 RepID=A0A1P6CD15_BRUMA|nr:Uncharacterized protein BM_BM7610 [Brugia malayi]CDP93697.1 Bm7610, isoform f [Brugia malayi]VIO92353.1 Uncharacterized protein BM_BM7610 [Brugia malayi]
MSSYCCIAGTSNTLSTPSIPQQSAPRTISSVITKKTTGEQLCQPLAIERYAVVVA